MANIFGGMVGKAEKALRNRQTQIEKAVDAGVQGGHQTTAHEMISTVPEGTTIHMGNGEGGYQFKTTKGMSERSRAKTEGRWPWQE